MLNIVVLLNSPEGIQSAYRECILAADAEVKVEVINDVSLIDPHLKTMDILMTYGPFLRDRADHIFRNAPRLRWIQALGSGVDGLTPDDHSRGEIVVTCIRGIQDAAVSEATFAAMLALSRDLPRSIRNQDRRIWNRQPSRLLEGKTVGILGVGLIGTALARRCKAFDMNVIGITSRTGTIAHFDQLRSRNNLAANVCDLDFLVVLAPHNRANHHLVNSAVLSAMKRTSYLVNVARGGVVEEAALIDALEHGGIAGAALDVFAEEPLPQAHPFWTMANVIVTPHTAGMNVDSVTKSLPIIRQNIAAFKTGNIAGMAGLVGRTRLETGPPSARSARPT